MIDPPRILGPEGRPDTADPRAELKRALLDAARKEAPAPPEARRELLEALGLGGVAAGEPAAVGRTAWQPRPPLFSSVLQPRRADPRHLAAGALACAAAFAALFVGGAGAPPMPVAELETVVELRGPLARLGGPGPRTPGPAPEAPAPEADLVPAGKGDAPAHAAGSGAPAALAGAAPGASPPVVAGLPAPPPDEAREPGGAVAGVAVDSVAPAPSSQVLPFGEGMSPPRLLEGAEPVYPLAAREARITGTMLARCVITTTGTLQGCRILKSLPYLDEPVLEALAHRRYTPVVFQGRPVDVEYVIPFRFELR